MRWSAVGLAMTSWAGPSGGGGGGGQEAADRRLATYEVVQSSGCPKRDKLAQVTDTKVGLRPSQQPKKPCQRCELNRAEF